MQKKQKKDEKKNPKKVTPKKGGPWKRAGSSSTIFSQRMGFFKILKKPYFYSVSWKTGGRHFLKKAMLQGGHF